MSVDEVLAERKNTHGPFSTNAKVVQNLKRDMQASPNWPSLPDNMREALEMVQHKIGRILCGNPMEKDHWTDIIGYTRLVEKEL